MDGNYARFLLEDGNTNRAMLTIEQILNNVQEWQMPLVPPEFNPTQQENGNGTTDE